MLHIFGKKNDDERNQTHESLLLSMGYLFITFID